MPKWMIAAPGKAKLLREFQNAGYTRRLETSLSLIVESRLIVESPLSGAKRP
jgi:hypothetical protein